MFLLYLIYFYILHFVNIVNNGKKSISVERIEISLEYFGIYSDCVFSIYKVVVCILR